MKTFAMTAVEALRHSLRQLLGSEAADIEIEGHTLADAGCDDLDAVEVVMTVEEDLAIEIADSYLGWDESDALMPATSNTKLKDVVAAIQKGMDAA